MLWFIPGDDPVDGTLIDWSSQLEEWLKLIEPAGRYIEVEGVVQSLDELTARDYVESDILDLDHMSTRGA